MFFNCLLMAGTFTPNSSASPFCESQTVSSLRQTSTFTAPPALWLLDGLDPAPVRERVEAIVIS